MNTGLRRNRLLAMVLLIVGMSNLYAGIPLWTFTPLTPTITTVATNSVATVEYRLTNQTAKTFILETKHQPGIVQNTIFAVPVANVCSMPIVLPPHASCHLYLFITGNQLPNQILGGPTLCENGNQLQCYQPNQIDVLNIKRSETPAVATLSISPNTLTLKTNGNPRRFTVKNTSLHNKAFSVNYTLPDISFPGTQISPASCGDLSPGQTCTLTITPGGTPSVAPGTINPVPAFLAVQGSNTDAVTGNFNVFTYGNVHEGGYIFEIQDEYTEAPINGSIHGKALALTNQAVPLSRLAVQDPNGIIWSSKGLGRQAIDVDFADIISVNSNALSPCDAIKDGHCNTKKIIEHYDNNCSQCAAGPPTPKAFYAAGLCDALNGGYSDWYLPAICELGPSPVGGGAGCDANIDNVAVNLSFLSSVDCNNKATCLAGYYFSSTQLYTTVVQNQGLNVFLQLMHSDNMELKQDPSTKALLAGVRCARKFS